MKCGIGFGSKKPKSVHLCWSGQDAVSIITLSGIYCMFNPSEMSGL